MVQSLGSLDRVDSAHARNGYSCTRHLPHAEGVTVRREYEEEIGKRGNEERKKIVPA
jgi:hypothetical protein